MLARPASYALMKPPLPVRPYLDPVFSGGAARPPEQNESEHNARCFPERHGTTSSISMTLRQRAASSPGTIPHHGLLCRESKALDADRILRKDWFRAPRPAPYKRLIPMRSVCMSTFRSAVSTSATSVMVAFASADPVGKSEAAPA